MNTSQISISITSNDLSSETKEAMWEVYQPYYSYDKTSFLSRFHKNNHYALYYKAGNLVGFTGLRINEAKIDGKKHFMIYFGQTVVSHGFRGKGLILMTGIKLIRQYWKQILFSKAWFWADALSYKAYLVFAKNLTEYYPTHQFATPQAVKQVFDFIGETHYGDCYCPQTGTVHKSVKYVADPSVAIRKEDTQDADVSFYAQANPLSHRGHGLITLGPISASNVMNLVQRAIRKAFAFSSKKSSEKKQTPSLAHLTPSS